MIDWNPITSVFLDMDGTLLDLHFDNYFWLEVVPQCYSQKNGCDQARAKQEIYERYRAVKGTLQWYCVDYWAAELQLDIAGLKAQLAHLICVHPHVLEFLAGLRTHGKRLVLVTNAHQKSVNIKLATTNLAQHFDRIIISHELGEPKESERFWSLLSQYEPHDPAATLLIDDNLAVLRAAGASGIAHLLTIKRPDSHGHEIDSGEFKAIDHFNQIMPQS